MKKNKRSFRELIVAISFASTQKELDALHVELSNRPFWMRGSKV